MSNNLILQTLIVSQKAKILILFNIFDNYGKICAVIQVKNLILFSERILRFIISIIQFYSLFYYLVTVVGILLAFEWCIYSNVICIFVMFCTEHELSCVRLNKRIFDRMYQSSSGNEIQECVSLHR